MNWNHKRMGPIQLGGGGGGHTHFVRFACPNLPASPENLAELSTFFFARAPEIAFYPGVFSLSLSLLPPPPPVSYAYA